MLAKEKTGQHDGLKATKKTLYKWAYGDLKPPLANYYM